MTLKTITLLAAAVATGAYAWQRLRASTPHGFPVGEVPRDTPATPMPWPASGSPNAGEALQGRGIANAGIAAPTGGAQRDLLQPQADAADADAPEAIQPGLADFFRGA